MSSIVLNKRRASTAFIGKQLSKSSSFKPGEVPVYVYVDAITEQSYKNKKTKQTCTYYSVRFTPIVGEKTFIKARTKPSTGDVEDESNKKARVEGDGETAAATTPGMFIEFKDTLFSSVFDASLSFKPGDIIRVGMSCTWSNKHSSYFPNMGAALEVFPGVTDKLYTSQIAGTPLAEVPSLENMSDKDWSEDVNPEYRMRPFYLPLSGGAHGPFADVEIVVGSGDEGENVADRLCCFEGMGRDEICTVGVNTVVGGEKRNQMPVLFKTKDDKTTFMTLAYKPQVWACFGVQNLDHWTEVGTRLLYNAQGWYAVGKTNIDRVRALACNADGEENDVITTTGWVSSMNVDMRATAERVGVEVPYDYLVEQFGPDSGYKNHVVMDSEHVLNTKDWKIAVATRKSFVLNLTDMAEEYMSSYLKLAQNVETVKHYAVFKNDEVYEFAGTHEERLAFIREKGYTPTVVFAVN